MTLNMAEQSNTQQLILMTLSATAGIRIQHNDTKHYVMLCAAFYRNSILSIIMLSVVLQSVFIWNIMALFSSK